MKTDVLDYVAERVSSKTKDDKLLKAVLESIEETRAMFQGEQYIRKDNHKEKLAFRLWLQQKTTDKTMQDVYKYISLQVELSPLTIKNMIIKFQRGYNPYIVGEDADCI